MLRSVHGMLHGWVVVVDGVLPGLVRLDLTLGGGLVWCYSSFGVVSGCEMEIFIFI